MTSTSHPIATHAPRPRCRRVLVPAATATTSGRAASLGSVGEDCSGSMADPRVEDAVEQVDDEVHDDVAAADQRHARLQRDVLPLGDRLEDHEPDTGQGED